MYRTFLIIIFFIPITIFSQQNYPFEEINTVSGIYVELGKARFSDLDMRINFGSPVEYKIGIFKFYRKSHSGLIFDCSYLKRTQLKIKNAEVTRIVLSLEYARCAFTSKGEMIFFISGGLCYGWRNSKVFDIEKEKLTSNIGITLKVGGLYRLTKHFGINVDTHILILKTGKLDTGSISYKFGISYII